ncbi:MAG: PQQ-binding-like beta-propeller repeat protein [Rubricoccaceae bacterium]|nr:PQQ-binding-like beta-propeller repeat protein [Rubricoccaceae bacterium]
MQLKRVHIAFLCFAFWQGGCESLRLGQALIAGDSDWVQEGGSESRTRATDDLPNPPLVERWHYNGNAGFGHVTPLLVGNHIILATRAGEIHVIDLLSGDKIGVASIGDAIEGTPVLASSRLLVAPVYGGKYGLVAYDLVKGAREWGIEDAHHEAGLLLLGDNVVGADEWGVVRMLDVHTGNVHWETEIGSSIGVSATPSLTESGFILVVDREGVLVLLDPESGEVISEHDLGLAVLNTPSLARDTAFIPTTQGVFLALDLITNEILWTLEAGNPHVRFAAPAVGESTLVVGATDGIVRRLALQSGEVLWEQLFDGNISAAPVISESLVFVGTFDRKLAALDAQTGEVLWETELEGRIKSPPVAQDGILVVLSEPKDVVAYVSEQLAER